MSDCDPMDCSMAGFPVHHQLPEPTQTHVHRVADAKKKKIYISVLREENIDWIKQNHFQLPVSERKWKFQSNKLVYISETITKFQTKGL